MVLTAIIMGLAGGLHCAGMCGPLVLAATAKNPFLGNKLIYNVGRILTYGILGMLAGALGGIIQFTAFQNIVAYLIGGFLLLLGFGAINGVRVPYLSYLVHRFTAWLKTIFGKFLQRKRNMFFLGMLNGLLPCGLTYLALTYCFTLDSFAEGFLFMILFGLGTIPVMVGVLWLLGITLRNFNLNYRRLSMIVLLGIGSLVIGRTLISHSNHMNQSTHPEGIAEEVICR